YPESGLLNRIEKCKTKKRQQWRNASANAATKKLTELAKYFFEFTPFVESLKNYFLCERHYNQIITKPSFIKQLTNESVKPTSVNFEVQVSLSTINVGVQVSLPTVDFGVQVSLPTIDFGVQVSLPDLKYEILLEQISKLESANAQLLAKNKALKKKLCERFTNQQDRIKFIIEIAKKERNNLYEDIEEELLLEKNQETNVIDDLVNSQSQIGNMKKCCFCQVSDIDNKKQIWHPIPITCEEVDFQKTKNSLTKSQLSSIINSLIPSLGDSDHSHFRGLSNKSHNDLINILREIRSVVAKNSINIG
ncbi:3106_t:CDS:2, partial [Racocetra persica]